MSSQTAPEAPSNSRTAPKGVWLCLVAALLFLISALGTWADLNTEYGGFQVEDSTFYNNEHCGSTTCTYSTDTSTQNVSASRFTPLGWFGLLIFGCLAAWMFFAHREKLGAPNWVPKVKAPEWLPEVPRWLPLVLLVYGLISVLRLVSFIFSSAGSSTKLSDLPGGGFTQHDMGSYTSYPTFTFFFAVVSLGLLLIGTVRYWRSAKAGT